MISGRDLGQLAPMLQPMLLQFAFLNWFFSWVLGQVYQHLYRASLACVQFPNPVLGYTLPILPTWQKDEGSSAKTNMSDQWIMCSDVQVVFRCPNYYSQCFHFSDAIVLLVWIKSTGGIGHRVYLSIFLIFFCAGTFYFTVESRYYAPSSRICPLHFWLKFLHRYSCLAYKPPFSA